MAARPNGSRKSCAKKALQRIKDLARERGA